MPARLKPSARVPGSIVTLTSEPTWTGKKGIARVFTVSTRTVDYWRAAGWFLWIKVKGIIRFPIQDCQLAVAKRFKN
jgi:hypothetical protein